MAFPIEFPLQLPAVGASNERATLDFKTSWPVEHRLEAAKDVAAFANAYGGTIIIGAIAKGEVLSSYRPLSAKEASGAQRCFEEGVRDRCRPIPRFTVEVIPFEEGLLVAVNIWPSLGQPVGVELKKQADLVRNFEDVYLYPLRAGAHTVAITPDQMHMYVDAKFRRTVIALQGSIGRQVMIVGHDPEGDWLGVGKVDFIDEQANALGLILDFDDEAKRYLLPLDLIENVWRDSSKMRIKIPGCLREVSFPDSVPGDGYYDEQVIFLPVAPPRARTNNREQKVRITALPTAAILTEIENRVRSWFRRRRGK